MDSLDQILALGNHLSSRSSEMTGIQTADLLNLHSEEKSFDPFANSSVSTTGSISGLERKPSISIHSSTCSVVPSIPPPPGQSGSQSQNMPNNNTPHLKTTFSDTFGDSFVSTNVCSSLHVNPLIPPPAKSPKVKATSSGITHYSTIRPRKKSNNESEPSPPLPSTSYHTDSSNTSFISVLPPPMTSNSSTLKVHKTCSEKKSPNSLKSTAIIPRPTSVNSNASSSPRSKTNVDSFDSQPFGTSFTTETSSSSAHFDRLDLFTDLDPLGTGRSRPYVDKKDFFQDLKKTNIAPKRLLKQMSTSQVEGIEHYSKDWHQQLTVDEPFGISHFGGPEHDPFDTNFASMTPPLFSASFNSPTAIPQPTSSVSQPSFPSPPVTSSSSNNSYSKISKTSNFYAKVWSDSAPVAISPPQPLFVETSTTSKPNSSSRLCHGPLRVVIPVAGQSDSDSEVASLTPRNVSSSERREQSSAASGNGSLSWSPQVSPSLRPLRADAVRLGVEAAKTMQPGSTDSPVPPLELSSSEEDSSSSEETSDRELSNRHKQSMSSPSMPPQPPPRPPVLRPPPLPPKGQPPLLPQRPMLTPTDELVYSGNRTPPLPIPIRKPKQQLSVNISGPQRSRRVSQEDSNHSSGSPAKPIQSNNKLNQISLLQLSNMSLSELAATLQLPPARLASMTLTELALRLAELNNASENEEKLRHDGDKEKKKKSTESISVSHSYIHYPPEEDEEEEDEDEEEDEEEAVEIKMDEAEVCYKGGKQYEILSDEPDPIEQASTTVQQVQSNQSDTPRSTEPSATSDSDRYAALREIMEQDLAVSCSPHHVDRFEDEANFEFANFDSVPVPTMSETDVTENTLNGKKQSAFGFEDDFSHIQLSRAREESPPIFAMETGARPKTNITTKTLRGASSVSSGSVDFDSFVDEDLTVKSAMQCSNASATQGTIPNGTMQVNVLSAISTQGMEVEADRFNDANHVVDDLADKFAAFEARFPANPAGFGDSFADFDLSSGKAAVAETDNIANQSVPIKSDSFAADFDSAFQSSEKILNDNLSIKTDKIVKKSQSVNIFKRVDDPFDDDFFENDSNVAVASPSVNASSVNSKNKQPVKIFSTIVEDPFAWVQPFDDQVQFDDDTVEHFAI